MRERFGRATAYAKRLNVDADMKAYYTKYRKKAASAFNAAMRDYHRAPKIEGVTIEPGNNGARRLVVHAKDDTAIAGFRCWHAGGDLVAEANVAYDMFTIWVPEGINRVCIEVTDRPGNVTAEEIEVLTV
jgi:hypothetical protein